MAILKEKFLIKGLGGGKKLKGTIAVGGAKNAALPLMASSILFKKQVAFENIPDIEDIKRMGELLELLGVEVERTAPHSYTLNASKITSGDLDKEIAKRMRASVLLTGPLLARRGSVSFPHPGGCVIGERPIDLFLEGFKKMGAVVEEKGERYHISLKPKKKLKGTEIFFRVQSPTATETFIMAGLLAEGRTVLKNCALEPEVKDLADFLISCGADIKGAGTTTIEINGGKELAPPSKPYAVIPDRIEAGSFLILGALCAETLEITNCEPSHLESITALLRLAGVKISIGKNKITVSSNKKTKNNGFRSVSVKTHEYPGFPTDFQAPMSVFLTQASGESLIFETIFEGRLSYAEDLTRMGANLTVWDAHRMMIKGPTPLKGRELEAPDIRAGLAYLIAAAVAKGESVINNVYYIDRGYEAIEKRLRPLGLEIERMQ